MADGRKLHFGTGEIIGGFMGTLGGLFFGAVVAGLPGAVIGAATGLSGGISEGDKIVQGTFLDFEKGNVGAAPPAPTD